MPTPSEMESTVANIQKTNLVAQFQLQVEPAKMTHTGSVTKQNANILKVGNGVGQLLVPVFFKLVLQLIVIF